MILNVLVWAGLELIFFTVICMGLCLEFVLSTNVRVDSMAMFLLLLSRPQHRAKTISDFRAATTGEEVGSAWEIVRRQPGQVTTTDQRDIPDLTT